MWIVLNKSFLSIVKNRNNDEELLVRSRISGDIEKVFKNANVFEDLKADYRYRSYISYRYRSYIRRSEVAKTISKELLNINYDNFKNSVSKDDKIRLNAYMDDWSSLYKMQTEKN